MHRRTSRGNRVGLILVGSLLTLIGAALVVAYSGVFGTAAKDTPLYPKSVDQWVFGHQWVYWIVAVVGLIVAVLALRWLLVQFRTDGIGRLRMDSDRPGAEGSGRTSLSAGAITGAITDDAEAITGVRSASASLSGARDAPELWLSVTVDDEADTGAIRDQILTSVLADARTALEMPNLPVYLTLTVSSRSGDRQVV